MPNTLFNFVSDNFVYIDLIARAGGGGSSSGGGYSSSGGGGSGSIYTLWCGIGAIGFLFTREISTRMLKKYPNLKLPK